MEIVFGILLAVGVAALVAVWLRRRGKDELIVGESPSTDSLAHDYDEHGQILSEVRVLKPRDLMPDERARQMEANGPTPPAADGSKHDLTPSSESAVATQVSAEEAPQEDVDRVLVLHVLAPHGSRFRGLEIRAALISEGLVLGRSGFFGRRDERNGCIKWRVANMLQPGTFDVAGFEEMHTPGLTLFMALPGPFSFLDAFDDLVNTGRRLSERLGGVLADDKRQRLSDQTISYEREAVIDYATQQKREQTELQL